MQLSRDFYVVIVVIVSAYCVAGDDAPAADPAPEPAPAPPAPADSPAAPAPAKAAAPAGPAKIIQLDAATTVSPDEITIEEKIGDLKVKQCMLLFGDCWASLKRKKIYLKDEKRIRICLKRTLGFSFCGKMTQENAKQAREEMEKLIKERWEMKEKKAGRDVGSQTAGEKST